jgi:hypothetical protein
LVDDLLRLSFDFPVHFIAYADDITIVTSHKDPAMATRHLQIVCDAVGAWLNSRKLSLNALKTVFVLFSRKRSAWPDLSIDVDGVKITPSSSVHYLGFIVDANVKWKEHLKAKCESAKRALLTANSCLRKSFGYDGKRLRFLYLSTVEPILSYGCSVWLSALKTKTSIKTLRSFQRFAAQLITRSFKTAPTVSLFVIANLLPLDLKLMKLAGVRYLSSKDGDCFSPSSLKTLVSRVPSVLGSPSIQPTSSFFQPDQPPWGICPRITSVAGAFVPLLSSHPKILRVVFWAIRVKEMPKFCVVASDSKQVRFIENCSLSTSSSHRRAICAALAKAVHLFQSQSHVFNSFEIFCPSRSAPAFLFPNARISSAESSVFHKILNLGLSCHLFLSADSLSPGFQLARVWAALSDEKIDSLLNAHCLDKAPVASRISDLLYKLWNEEWVSSSKGSATRLFFPTVSSASVLLKLRPSVGLYQLISGHCALNGHQKRFGFSETTACLCGHDFESAEHFLFDCPRFCHERLCTLTAARNSLPSINSWPPPLSSFPLHVSLWNALVSFVAKTKHLNLSLAGH